MSLTMRPLPPTPTIDTTPPTLEPRRPRPPDEPGASPSSSSAAVSCVCPNCGTTVTTTSDSDAAALLRQARQQIQELQAQVARLDQKAAAAIDRWADYEDELTGLRRQLSAVRTKPASPPDAATTTPPPTVASASSRGGSNSGGIAEASPTRPSFLPASAANRLSALLSPRVAKSTPNLKAAAADAAALPTPPPSASNSNANSRNPSLAAAFSPTAANGSPSSGGAGAAAAAAAAAADAAQQSTKELLQALTREQALRRAAEGRLQDTSREVEELSVSLFEQANEMVADERRARARLEARVATLEQRDSDKRRRLERLEQAMDRIARVRALLGEPAQQPTASSSRTGGAATPVVAATA